MPHIPSDLSELAFNYGNEIDSLPKAACRGTTTTAPSTSRSKRTVGGYFHTPHAILMSDEVSDVVCVFIY